MKKELVVIQGNTFTIPVRCGKCEDGWVMVSIKKAGEECRLCDHTNLKSCHKHYVARPCSCNPDGRDVIMNYRNDLNKQDWYKKSEAKLNADSLMANIDAEFGKGQA